MESERINGRGTLAGLCEARPTFYEVCSLGRPSNSAAGLAPENVTDKCLLPGEWEGRHAGRVRDPYSPQAWPLSKGHWGHSYERLYPLYLTPLRDRSITLLEIGSNFGGSLRLWCAYFTKPSHFAQLDLKPQYASLHQVASESCAGVHHTTSIHKVDQGDPTWLRAAALDGARRNNPQAPTAARTPAGGTTGGEASVGVGGESAGVYDVIVDDGSHFCEHIVTSFNTLFPLLKPGGVYFIEDLNVGYASGCHTFVQGLVEFVHAALLETGEARKWPSRGAWPSVQRGTIASVNCVLEACAVVKSF